MVLLLLLVVVLLVVVLLVVVVVVVVVVVCSALADVGEALCLLGSLSAVPLLSVRWHDNVTLIFCVSLP
jgi:hypothetical protein